MKTTATKIGLFGYGVVGKGFHHLALAHPQLLINTKHIVIKNESKHCLANTLVSRGDSLAAQNSRPADAVFSADADDILKDLELSTVIEVINNSEDAYRIAQHVLSKGNTLITANKKMLAEHFTELLALEDQYGGCLLYEASSAASIPIIRILDQYFANEEIQLLEGILNGTSNFILSSVFNQHITYHEALNLAQSMGFAEADPTLDVDGYDALSKLIIIIASAFGVLVKPEHAFNYGIRHIGIQDIEFARKNHCTIKQIAHAGARPDGKLTLYVAPQFVKNDQSLAHVNAENNGIIVDALYSGRQFYSGKGAGSNPTGAAVLADVIASKQHKNYAYTKLKKPHQTYYDDSTCIPVYLRYAKLISIQSLNINIKKQECAGDYYLATGEISLRELKAKKQWLEENNISVIVWPS